MTTAHIEELIYDKLSHDTSLLSHLANGADSIFHLQSPAKKLKDYPFIVFSPISDVPFFFADNLPLAHKLTFRFHIITLDAEFTDIDNDIHRIMTDLHAERFQSTPYSNDKRKTLIVDFRLTLHHQEPEPLLPTVDSSSACSCCNSQHNFKLITDSEINDFFDKLEEDF